MWTFHPGAVFPYARSIHGDNKGWKEGANWYDSSGKNTLPVCHGNYSFPSVRPSFLPSACIHKKAMHVYYMAKCNDNNNNMWMRGKTWSFWTSCVIYWFYDYYICMYIHLKSTCFRYTISTHSVLHIVYSLRHRLLVVCIMNRHWHCRFRIYVEGDCCKREVYTVSEQTNLRISSYSSRCNDLEKNQKCSFPMSLLC